MSNPNSNELRKCAICNGSYYARKYKIKIGQGLTCSLTCAGKWRSKNYPRSFGNCHVARCNWIGPLLLKKYCRTHYAYHHNHGVTEPQHFNSKPLHIPIADATWLAGVIDCDGWVGLMQNNNGNKSGPPALWGTIGVGNVKEFFIDALMGKTGVGIKSLSHRKPPARHLYMWTVTKRADLESLILTILPHLIIKRRQARLLLLQPPLHSRKLVDRKRRERIQKLIKALNKKGVNNRSFK